MELNYDFYRRRTVFAVFYARQQCSTSIPLLWCD